MFDGITEVANAPLYGLLAVIAIILLLSYREVLRFNQKNVEAGDVSSEKTIQDWREVYAKLEGKVDKITELYNRASENAAIALDKLDTILSELTTVREELKAVKKELLNKDAQLAKLEQMFERPLRRVIQLEKALNDNGIFVPPYTYIDDEGVVQTETPAQSGAADKAESEVVAEEVQTGDVADVPEPEASEPLVSDISVETPAEQEGDRI